MELLGMKMLIYKSEICIGIDSDTIKLVLEDERHNHEYCIVYYTSTYKYCSFFILLLFHIIHCIRWEVQKKRDCNDSNEYYIQMFLNELCKFPVICSLSAKFH